MNNILFLRQLFWAKAKAKSDILFPALKGGAMTKANNNNKNFNTPIKNTPVRFLEQIFISPTQVLA